MGDSDKKNIVPVFVPDPNLKSQRVYANFASVRHTGLDFTISFADVLPPSKEQVTEAAKGKAIDVPLQCQIVVPNDLVPALIKALQDQYGKYLSNIEKNADKKDTKGDKK